MSDVAAVEATHDVSSERISRKCPHALQINSCRCRGNHHGHSYDFQFQSERNEAGGRITSNLKPLQKKHVWTCLFEPFGFEAFWTQQFKHRGSFDAHIACRFAKPNSSPAMPCLCCFTFKLAAPCALPIH